MLQVRTTALAQLLFGVGNANRFRDHQRGHGARAPVFAVSVLDLGGELPGFGLQPVDVGQPIGDCRFRVWRHL